MRKILSATLALSFTLTSFATTYSVSAEFKDGQLRMKGSNDILESRCLDATCEEVRFFLNGRRITKKITKADFSLKLEDYGEKKSGKSDFEESAEMAKMTSDTFKGAKDKWKEGDEGMSIFLGSFAIITAPVVYLTSGVIATGTVVHNIFASDDIRVEKLKRDIKRLEKTAKIIEKMSDGNYELSRGKFLKVVKHLKKAHEL